MTDAERGFWKNKKKNKNKKKRVDIKIWRKFFSKFEHRVRFFSEWTTRSGRHRVRVSAVVVRPNRERLTSEKNTNVVAEAAERDARACSRTPAGTLINGGSPRDVRFSRWPMDDASSKRERNVNSRAPLFTVRVTRVKCRKNWNLKKTTDQNGNAHTNCGVYFFFYQNSLICDLL